MAKPYTFNVKVTEDEHLLTYSNSWVVGLIEGRKDYWALVELGTEVEFNSRRSEDIREERKKFIRCKVFLARTREKLEYVADTQAINNCHCYIYK